MIFFRKNRQLWIILVLILIVVFIDITNIDNILYKFICNALGLVFKTICTGYYDIPIWEAAVATGTFTAAYFAYQAIQESNKRLEIEQSPHVVIQNGISIAVDFNEVDRLHTISLKNIGKGRALNIVATADPEGKISIIDGSNPNSIDLRDGEVNTSWAIDERQVIKGLKKQNIEASSVVNDMPDENDLDEDEKEKADFHLFLWYSDQMGNRYKTTTKFRHSSQFIKVMSNDVGII